MLKQMMQFVEDQVLIYGNTSLQCSFHSKQKVYYSVGVGGGGRGGEVYAYVSGVCVYVGVGGRPMRPSAMLFVNYFFTFFCVLLIWDLRFILHSH